PETHAYALFSCGVGRNTGLAGSPMATASKMALTCTWCSTYPLASHRHQWWPSFSYRTTDVGTATVRLWNFLRRCCTLANIQCPGLLRASLRYPLGPIRFSSRDTGLHSFWTLNLGLTPHHIPDVQSAKKASRIR